MLGSLVHFFKLLNECEMFMKHFMKCEDLVHPQSENVCFGAALLIIDSCV